MKNCWLYARILLSFIRLSFEILIILIIKNARFWRNVNLNGGIVSSGKLKIFSETYKIKRKKTSKKRSCKNKHQNRGKESWAGDRAGQLWSRKENAFWSVFYPRLSLHKGHHKEKHWFKEKSPSRKENKRPSSISVKRFKDSKIRRF